MSSNYQSAGQQRTDNAQQPDKAGSRLSKKYKEAARRYPRTMEAGKDLLIDMLAGLAGAAVGAMIGRPSLLIGAGVNFTGHYLDKKAVSTFGTAMAVANIIQSAQALSGTEETKKTKWEEAKERLSAYKDGIIHKLYLDKVFKKDQPGDDSTSSTTTDSKTVGEVKHFIYPYDSIIPENQGQRVEIETSVQGNGDLDFSALDAIENKLAESASTYQKNNSIPAPQSMSGLFGELVEDPLY